MKPSFLLVMLVAGCSSSSHAAIIARSSGAHVALAGSCLVASISVGESPHLSPISRCCANS